MGKNCCTASTRVSVVTMTPKRLLLLVVAVVAIIPAAVGQDDTAEIGGNKNILQSAESGGGKSSSASDDNDERKTLSQQVADGKYGLIQRELFADGGPSPPGVLSYDANPEIPRDTSDNLGGLTREEIWLAEDHLLVLRGGKFKPEDSAVSHSVPVPPIDDYRAPARQVKIPSKPRVPPPFPVQLHDDGPIQILEAATPEDDAKTTPAKASTDRTNKANTAAGRTPQSHATHSSTTSNSPPENYRSGAEKGAGLRRPQYPSGPAPNPLDEDDPSIYYPPPYSFYYPIDNSTAVPPGPLVPGIVLPPPPNFFGKLSPNNVSKSPSFTTTSKAIITTKPPPLTTKTKLYLPPPTSIPAPQTVIKSPKIITETLHIISKTPPPPKTDTVTQAPKITTPAPKIVTQAPKPIYFEYFERSKPILVQNSKPPPLPPQPSHIQTYVSSTGVPLRVFFRAPIHPAQFYFYEEDPSINEVNTRRTPARYYIATVAKPQHSVPSINNFDHHIHQISQQIQLGQRQFNKYQKNSKYKQSQPRYEYNFGYNEGFAVTPQPPQQYNVQIHRNINYRNHPPSFQGVSQPVTPNSNIENAYFTKPDESQFDEITKKYFTLFGQKLTSPLPPLLRDDININYRRPLPPPNPQAEYLSRGNDIAATAGAEKHASGTFISYQLPGDGAHFYFSTPQLAATQQEQRQRSDTGYYYPAPPRL